MSPSKPSRSITAACLLAVLCSSTPAGLCQVPDSGAVRAWEEPLVVPTYEVALPDENPRFYSGRVYQGARASFYPYPVYDRLTDRKTDRTYRAVYLENRYVRICVLPEIGGRIFSAVDKTNGYDFFYRQHVIKPALIGMLGAWISGGVEWNVPHHHRATSFLPVDCRLTDGPDGGKTVWVGETEWRHRMRWIIGLTLHPDRSYIDMTVKIFNGTPVANSLLFWINPAVHANPDYQVIFPPSTEFAVQHGKPEFARWPMASSVYGGVDYTRGVDISWWKNHPAPVSFFAWNSDEDFFGGYDHGRRAGVLHVANHHVVPGKKFFEWGNGPQGEMWTKILTDADGPYLELMAGAWSDNQPDYSWCQPGEVKIFKQYWYPIREMGGAKNAGLDAAVNLDVTPERVARLAFNATAEFPDAVALLVAGDRVLLRKEATVGPGKPLSAEVQLPAGLEEKDLRASLRTKEGRELMAYRPVVKKESPMPSPVARPQRPSDLRTGEDLYLTGLRLEQLHSPAMDPEPFYEEAIRRDPGDYRAGTALGILYIKHGRFSDAEARLRAAVERATASYLRPKDGEAFYYLGVALRAQGRTAEARDAFWRSMWSQAWKAAGYFALAELECAGGNAAAALDLVNESLAAGRYNTKALDLKAAICRRLGMREDADRAAREALAIDPLDLRASWELCRQVGTQGHGSSPGVNAELSRLEAMMRGMDPRAQSLLEIAVDYGNCGLWEEAVVLLKRIADAAGNRSAVEPMVKSAVDSMVKPAVDPMVKPAVDPMVYYHLGYCSRKLELGEVAEKFYRLAASQPHEYCFPFRFESAEVLEEAGKLNPADFKAPYYLGNLLFDHQPERAIACWEASVKISDSFWSAHRNLGIGYMQARGDIPRAIAAMEKAVALHPDDARLYYELDVLYEEGNLPLEKRIEALSRKPEVVARRDDASTRAIIVNICLGRLDEAIATLEKRHFRNWEGRSELHDVYMNALLQRGKERLGAGKPREALADFEATLRYPENLEVGPPYRDARAAEAHYWIGAAEEGLRDAAAARGAWEKAVASSEGSLPETRYCVALALRKLGREEESARIFEELLDRGRKDLEAASSVDYFAKFGEKQSERARKARAHYLIGLGYEGQGKKAEAVAEFKAVLDLDVGHLGARTHLEQRAAAR